jgi:AcrR family transcriptional regulator
MATDRPALSRERIVEVAIELLKDRGVDGLTMRTLSDRLGVSLGATYKHVANKHALLALIADALYDQILSAKVDCSELVGLKVTMYEIATTFDAYPGMAAYVGRHLGELGSVALAERITGSLRALGLSAEEAAVRMLALVTFVAGHLLVDLGDQAQAGRAAALELGIDRLLSGIESP